MIRVFGVFLMLAPSKSTWMISNNNYNWHKLSLFLGPNKEELKMIKDCVFN